MSRPARYEFGFARPDPRTRLAYLLEAWAIYERRPPEPTIGWRDVVPAIYGELSPGMRRLLAAHDEDALAYLRMRIRERLDVMRPVAARVFDRRSRETFGAEPGVYDRHFAARVVHAAHLAICGGRSFAATADALRVVCGGHAAAASLTRHHVAQAVRSHLARETHACDAMRLTPELVLARSTRDLFIAAALDDVRARAEEAAIVAFGAERPRGAALARETDATMGVATTVEDAIARIAAVAAQKQGEPALVARCERLADGARRERQRLTA